MNVKTTPPPSSSQRVKCAFLRIQECRQRAQTGGGVHEQEAQSG